MASRPRKKPAVGTARAARAKAKAAQAKAGKSKADRAAARAKAAGATGARLPAAKIALRDSMIIARAAQGMPYASIAAEAGVTTRTIERVVRTSRGIRSPLMDTPMELLDELAVGFRLSIGDYEAMASAFVEHNPAVALGAKKAADETRARLQVLMTDVGKLPKDLENFRGQAELERVAKAMAAMMRRVEAGDITVQEAIAFFGSLGPQAGVVVEITDGRTIS